MKRRHWRLRKFILPGLQTKLIAPFVLLACASALFQGIVLTRALGRLAARAGDAEGRLLAGVSDLITESMIAGMAFLIALNFVVGVIVTFRVAGPIYRFEQYLTSIAAGEYSGPCRIRKNDELHRLCDLINRAVDRLRQSGEDEPGEAASAKGQEAAELRRTG